MAPRRAYDGSMPNPLRFRLVLVFLALGAPCLAAVYLAAIAAAGLLTRPAPADLIVVLGNEVLADGRPSTRLQARLEAARLAYRAGLAPRVLVSGGIEPGGQDEAAVMAADLAAHGVPQSVILQDPQGVDTFATARNVAALLHGPEFGQGRVLAVTQWFHVPRTLLALRRFGVREASAAWPRFTEPRDAMALLREAVALPYYAFRSVPGR